MQGGADRSNLPHGAVAEVLAVELLWRKDERQRAGGKQVIDRDRHGHADPARALPGLEAGSALVERHRLARGVAGARDAEGGELAAVNRAPYRIKIEMLRQQLAERRIVEQRDRLAHEQAA